MTEFPATQEAFALGLIERVLFLVRTRVKETAVRVLFGVDGKEVFYFLQHLKVGSRKILITLIGDDALLIDAENFVSRNFDSQIGNRICFSISEASYYRFFRVRKDFVDAGQQLDFELIGCFFDDFSGEGFEIAVWTHQQGAGGQSHTI